ncbi:hypothetical protein SAMD00024442_6_51 [Candidatus Symbiothrix dinenymphae]|nr:hypothetical protein SAMD00024442_6_51 [Candidatus Symbiothrix dinenymphae]
MFDAYTYFSEICEKNKITSAGNYKFCRVSGLSYMEEVIQHFKSENAYFCVDDTEDGTLMNMDKGPVERRQYTVFLLKKYPLRTDDSMTRQHEALNECREIYRQIAKKLIRDKRFLENDLVYLHLDRIPFYEIPGYFISGCTGLYFMLTVDNPIDLCYDGNEWN